MSFCKLVGTLSLSGCVVRFVLDLTELEEAVNRAERTESFTKEKVYFCETRIENKEREIDDFEKCYSKSQDEHDLLQRQVQELG